MSKYPGIPQPTPDVRGLYEAVAALKEAVEALTGQRRGSQPPVTWDDLVRLGLIEEGDVPR